MDNGRRWPPQAQGRQPVRPHAPGVLQPKAAQPAQPKKGPAAPPVYRPMPAPKVLQRKAPVQPQRPPAAPSHQTPAAPPVYRPMPVPRVLQRKTATPQPPKHPAHAAATRPAPTPPPVYRPVQPKAVQPRAAAVLQARKAAPVAQRPPSPQAPARGAAVQPIICRGKTHRSKPFEKIKLSGWYRKLPSDNHRAFALDLHINDPEYYGIPEAEEIIDGKISSGVPVPTFDTSPKAERRRRVTEYINSEATKISDKNHMRGKFLALSSERAYHRLLKKYKRRKVFKHSVRTVNAVKPNLFANQSPILAGLQSWEQIVALTHSEPQSFDFDMDGTKVTLDSIDVKSNDERSKQRPQGEINKAQVFIELGGNNSYWGMSDSTDRSLANTDGHHLLRHLEVERNNRAANATYLKDALHSSGKMNNTQAYGDEGGLAFQEFKGALNPTQNMLKLQETSGFNVLEHAMKTPTLTLGKKVKKRPQTTPQNINNALKTFEKKKTEKNYKALVKENFRLIRSQTGVDLESDSEDDSDIEYKV